MLLGISCNSSAITKFRFKHFLALLRARVSKFEELNTWRIWHLKSMFHFETCLTHGMVWHRTDDRFREGKISCTSVFHVIIFLQALVKPCLINRQLYTKIYFWIISCNCQNIWYIIGFTPETGTWKCIKMRIGCRTANPHLLLAQYISLSYNELGAFSLSFGLYPVIRNERHCTNCIGRQGIRPWKGQYISRNEEIIL